MFLAPNDLHVRKKFAKPKPAQTQVVWCLTFRCWICLCFHSSCFVAVANSIVVVAATVCLLFCCVPIIVGNFINELLLKYEIRLLCNSWLYYIHTRKILRYNYSTI